MTIITSNTIITIPNDALFPTEARYYPLLISNTTQALYSTLATLGIEGLYVNPVATVIANTTQVVNTLITTISTQPNHLSGVDRDALFFLTNTTNAVILFTAPPANTSVIEIRYTEDNGNNSVLNRFVANGSQTSFVLSDNPIPTQIPQVQVNGVYQSNAAYGLTSKNYGLQELLCQRLLSHTNRLSGLEPARVSDHTDLQRILSTGIALNTLTNVLGSDSQPVYSSNNVMFCMSSLFCSDVLKTYRDIINNDIIVSIVGNTANVNLITHQLSEMVNGVSNMISSDIDFYRQIEFQLKYSTVSNFIQTAYNEPSGRYVIKHLIGTDRLKEILITGNT